MQIWLHIWLQIWLHVSSKIVQREISCRIVRAYHCRFMTDSCSQSCNQMCKQICTKSARNLVRMCTGFFRFTLFVALKSLQKSARKWTLFHADLVAHLVAHFLDFCVHNYASESKDFVKMAIPGGGALIRATKCASKCATKCATKCASKSARNHVRMCTGFFASPSS